MFGTVAIRGLVLLLMIGGNMIAIDTMRTERRFEFTDGATTTNNGHGGGGNRELAAAYYLPNGAELSIGEYYRTVIAPIRSLQKAKRTLETDRTAVRMWADHGKSIPKTWAEHPAFKKMSWRPVCPDPHDDPPIGWLVDDDLAQFVAKLRAENYAWTTIKKAVTHLRIILNFADRRDTLLKLPRFPELKGTATQNWIPTADDMSRMWDAAGELGDGDPLTHTQGADQARAVLVFTGILGLRPQDVSGIEWDRNLERTDDGRTSLVWVPQKTEWTRGEPMSIPLPPIVLHYLNRWRERSTSPLVFGAKRSVNRLWHRVAEAAGFTELTPKKQDGSQELVFSLKRLRKFANVRANAIRSPAGNWLLGHGVDRNDRTNFLHYSECFRAPEWVSEVLDSEQIALPFGGTPSADVTG